jgi:transcriptional regulator with XRE-family HTH domain
MSMNYDSYRPSAKRFRRQTWGQMFGRFIRHDRLKTGRSVEECARLAGMDASRWELIEAGQVLPGSKEELQTMAVALDMEWSSMVTISFFCRSAWD